jgi:hypothetical protein
LKQVVQVVTVVTRLFLQDYFCHHLVTTVTTHDALFGCGPNPDSVGRRLGWWVRELTH